MASQVLGHSPLIKPLVTLAGWTFVMEAWMYATRIPAISKYNIDVNPEKVAQDFNTKVPISIRQIAVRLPSATLSSARAKVFRTLKLTWVMWLV